MDFYEKFRHEAIKLKREAKRAADMETPLERAVHEATSNQNWGCANSILWDIAQASNQYSERQFIMRMVWEKLQSSPHRWRRILKTLNLIDFMLKHGPDQIRSEVCSGKSRILQLQNFSFMEDGRDSGANVRDKAKEIVHLVNLNAPPGEVPNLENLKRAREEARVQRSKMLDALAQSTGAEGRPGRPSGRSAGQSEGTAGKLAASIFGGPSISKQQFEKRFSELQRKRTEARAPGSADRQGERAWREDRGGDDSPVGSNRRADADASSPRRERSDKDFPRGNSPRAPHDEDEQDKQDDGYDIFDGPRGAPSDSDSDSNVTKEPQQVDLLDLLGETEDAAYVASPSAARQEPPDPDEFGFADLLGSSEPPRSLPQPQPQPQPRPQEPFRQGQPIQALAAPARAANSLLPMKDSGSSGELQF